MAALMLQLAAGAGLDAAGNPEATSIAEAGTTWMALEMPAQGAILPSSFAATGWALDPAASSGPGVDAIQLFAYRNFGSGESPIFLGNASYGSASPGCRIELRTGFHAVRVHPERHWPAGRQLSPLRFRAQRGDRRLQRLRLRRRHGRCHTVASRSTRRRSPRLRPRHSRSRAGRSTTRRRQEAESMRCTSTPRPTAATPRRCSSASRASAGRATTSPPPSVHSSRTPATISRSRASAQATTCSTSSATAR